MTLAANSPTLSDDLIAMCEDLCKVSLQLIDDALAAKPAPTVIMEKVAAASQKSADPALIQQVVDALDSRGMVNEGGREKLAALLQDPNELACTLLELTNVVRPSAAGGTPVDFNSLPTKSASAPSSELSEEEQERQEWRDLARSRQL